MDTEGRAALLVSRPWETRLYQRTKYLTELIQNHSFVWAIWSVPRKLLIRQPLVNTSNLTIDISQQGQPIMNWLKPCMIWKQSGTHQAFPDIHIYVKHLLIGRLVH